MTKWVVLILAAFVLYRLFMNDKKKKEDAEVQEKENLTAAGEMVKDPVCGAFVDAEGGITVRNGEEVIHFCSYECREKYLKQLEEQGKIEQ